jgi:hypothetical protein
MSETLTVKVTDRLTKRYPVLRAELADFLADGGEVGTLHGFTRDVAESIRRSKGVLVAVEGWVYLDDQPIAYLIEVRAEGKYTIKGGAYYV